MSLTVTKILLSKVLPPKVDRKNRHSKAYLAHFQKLAEDIKAHGVRTPIKVEQDGEFYRPRVGITRVAAARAAGQTDIPAHILPAGMSESDLLLEELAANNGPLPFDLLALVGIAHELKRRNGWTDAEVCRNCIGLTSSTLSKGTRILEGLCESLRSLYDAGELGTRLAYKLARHPAEEQERAYSLVRYMSVVDAERYLGGAPRGTRRPPVKLPLPGATVVFTDPTHAAARQALEAGLKAVARAEKLGLPLAAARGLIEQ